MSRRANGEGSKPVQRKDGRWQVGYQVLGRNGVGKRATVTGRTSKEAREEGPGGGPGPAPGGSTRQGRQGDTRRRSQRGWIASTLAASDRKATTKSMYATVARKHIVGAAIGRATARPAPALSRRGVEGRAPGARAGRSRPSARLTRSSGRSWTPRCREAALAKNPAAAVTRPKVTRKEAAHLTTAQVGSLLEQAEGGPLRAGCSSCW